MDIYDSISFTYPPTTILSTLPYSLFRSKDGIKVYKSPFSLIPFQSDPKSNKRTKLQAQITCYDSKKPPN
jgi:hypothetical protein